MVLDPPPSPQLTNVLDACSHFIPGVISAFVFFLFNCLKTAHEILRLNEYESELERATCLFLCLCRAGLLHGYFMFLIISGVG